MTQDTIKSLIGAHIKAADNAGKSLLRASHLRLSIGLANKLNPSPYRGKIVSALFRALNATRKEVA